jgi:CheY-like chemotaxis protein
MEPISAPFIPCAHCGATLRLPFVATADDSTVTRVQNARLLMGRGFSVGSYPSASHLLEEFVQYQQLGGSPNMFADLIILDYNMGPTSIDGVAAVASLRKQGYDLPIVILSASEEDSLRARCLEAGATELVAKPMTKEKAMDLHRLVREKNHVPSQTLPQSSASTVSQSRFAVADAC